MQSAFPKPRRLRKHSSFAWQNTFPFVFSLSLSVSVLCVCVRVYERGGVIGATVAWRCDAAFPFVVADVLRGSIRVRGELGQRAKQSGKCVCVRICGCTPPVCFEEVGVGRRSRSDVDCDVDAARVEPWSSPSMAQDAETPMKPAHEAAMLHSSPPTKPSPVPIVLQRAALDPCPRGWGH